MTIREAAVASEPAKSQAAGPAEAPVVYASLLAQGIAAAGVAASLVVVMYADASVPLLALVYVVTVGGMFGIVAGEHRAGRDCSAPMLAAIAAVAIGPPGALGASWLMAYVRRNPADGQLLEAWYERISLATATEPVTRLCDDVGVGRTMHATGPAPASYAGIIDSGPIPERQAVLGLIARRFHPDYLPVLRRALLSPEPAIRVQAAAVAAHLRPAIARHVRDCEQEIPEASASPARAIALLSRMEAAILSGFLDASDERRLRAIVPRLADVVLAPQADPRPGRALEHVLAGDARLRATMERILLARARFGDLRRLRSAVQVRARNPKSRIRRIVAHRRLPEAAE